MLFQALPFFHEDRGCLPPANRIAAAWLPFPGPYQHSLTYSMCRGRSANRFADSGLCETATVFHQSAHSIDYLSTMHDFDVAPLPGLKQHRIED